MSMKILVLCTGNSCRSQMAEGFLKSLDSSLDVYSAGTKPEKEVNPIAIKVMKEVDIDISMNKPKNVSIYLQDDFDYVITVCDDANETCPIFTGKAHKRMHIGFEDPAKAKGKEEEVLIAYRRIRDEIMDRFAKFMVW